jgi:hypothetical protein
MKRRKRTTEGTRWVGNIICFFPQNLGQLEYFHLTGEGNELVTSKKEGDDINRTYEYSKTRILGI